MTKVAYPAKLFVLEAQHARAFGEQLDLHDRKRLVRVEVTLGVPAAAK